MVPRSSSGGKPGPGGGGGNKKKHKQKPQTIRKSCDFCNSRKKKCDGNGIKRCSYCVEKKNPNCVHSARRPPKPRARKQRPKQLPSGKPRAAAGICASAAGAGAERTRTALLDALPRPSLKRGRFGASPATGLVGTQENTFLKVFFGLMGFLPLTCTSTVREAMCRLMVFSSASKGHARTAFHVGGAAPASTATGAAAIGDDEVLDKDEDTEAAGRISSAPAASGAAVTAAAAAAPPRERHDRQQQQLQQQGSSDPTLCMFWCAVALGGLAQGRPVEMMRRYICLAENALKGHVGPEVMPGVARAWTLMAYLHGFCGDSANFRSCQGRAEQCFRESGECEGGKPRFPDQAALELLIQHADGLDLFYGDGHVTTSHVQSYVQSFVRQERASHPQMREAATANDLCHFVMQSYHRFGQAFFTDVMGHRGGQTIGGGGEGGGGGAGGGEGGGGGSGVEIGPRSSATGAAGGLQTELRALLFDDGDDEDDDCYGDEQKRESSADCSSSSSMSQRGEVKDDAAAAPTAHATADVLVEADLSNEGGASGGWGTPDRVQERNVFFMCGERALSPPAHGSRNMQRMMEDAMPEYDRVQRAVEGDEVRGGIGGLMINCTSVVLKAAQRDIKGSVERISRCVEVLERYPGLIRFPMGLHISHLLLVMLAAFEERHLYTKLMAAYNPMRPSGSLRLPPLEEWEGIEPICTHVYCRAIQGRFRGKQAAPEVPEAAPDCGGHEVRTAHDRAVPGSLFPATSAATAATAAAAAGAAAHFSGGGFFEQNRAPYADGRTHSAPAGGGGAAGGGECGCNGHQTPFGDNGGGGCGGASGGSVVYDDHSFTKHHQRQQPAYDHPPLSSDAHEWDTYLDDLDPLLTLADIGNSASDFGDPLGGSFAEPPSPALSPPLFPQYAVEAAGRPPTERTIGGGDGSGGGGLGGGKAALGLPEGATGLRRSEGSVAALEAVIDGSLEDEDEDLEGGNYMVDLPEVTQTYLLGGDKEELVYLEGYLEEAAVASTSFQQAT